jgi:hypothetical protein
MLLTSKYIHDTSGRLALAHYTQAAAAATANAEASAASVASGIVIRRKPGDGRFAHLASAARRGSRIIEGMELVDPSLLLEAEAGAGGGRGAGEGTRRGSVTASNGMSESRTGGRDSQGRHGDARGGGTGTASAGRGTKADASSRARNENKGYKYYTTAATAAGAAAGSSDGAAPGAAAAGDGDGAHASDTLRYKSPLEKAHADIVASWNRRAAEEMEDIVASSYNNAFDAPFTALPSFWPKDLPRRAGAGAAGGDGSDGSVPGSRGGRLSAAGGVAIRGRAPAPAQTYAQVLGEM